MKPLFFVISAPSGAGKTTLCDLLLQHYPEMCYSVSCTTREPRYDEEDGIDYHFLSVARFKELIAEEQFLEYALVHDNYYGTLMEPVRSALREGQCVLLDIDVVGAAQIREHLATLPPGDALKEGFVDVFVKPPSMAELRARLELRSSDAAEIIEKRLINAERELGEAGKYMFQVVNDDLEMAYRRLCDIVNVKAEI